MVFERHFVRVACYGFAIVAVLFILFVALYAHAFGPAGFDTAQKEFVVTPKESAGDIAARLKQMGLIKSQWAFRLAYLREAGLIEARPGGYELSSSMDAWTIAAALGSSPYMAWVVIPPGLRKEQIADLLATDLSWTAAQKKEWLAVDTDPSPAYQEGVYYPDTYLIPSDMTAAQVAATLRNRFLDAFAPYAAEAAKKGVPWTDVVTMASLIEREAAGPDMKLIAGILWNRLDKGMLLQVDATLQYAKGNETNWWPVVSGSDKYIDSPFNTYKHAGLPPHPIANPPLAAIDAVLNPQSTSCIYYLHDPHGQIHCSVSYSGQLANVNKYLK